MSAGLFYVTTQNPNDVTGGAGCVCSPERQIDCVPPYIVVPGNDLENVASPHVVVCARCVTRMDSLLAGEALAAGERGNEVDATVVDDDDVPEV